MSESSYSPQAPGAGPPFRVVKVQTLADGVLTTPDVEVVTLADPDGRLISADALASLAEWGPKFDDMLTHLRQLVYSRLQIQLVDAAGSPVVVSSDGSLSVNPSPPLVAVGTLSALNATVTLSLQNRPFAGVTIIGSQGFTGTLVCEFSTDNQVNWDSRVIWNGDGFVTGDILPNGNGINKRTWSIPSGPADTDVRVRVLAYTLGACVARVSATSVEDRQGSQTLGLGIDQGILGAGGGPWCVESVISQSVGGGDEASPRQHRTPHVVNVTPAEADYGFVVRPLNQNRVIGPTALAALNATIQVSTQGQYGVGFWVGASSLVGTLVLESSADGGTTWVNDSILDEIALNWLTAGIVNPAASKRYTSLAAAGSKLVRLRVSAFTSGSVTVTLMSSQIISALALMPTISIDAVNSPIFFGPTGGVDAAGAARITRLVNGAPLFASYGQVVRPIPREVVSYSAPYRLADATAGQLSLTFTFVANTNKQLGTIYHGAGSTKVVRIRKISIIVSTGALGIFNFEVRALSATTAPATGNPAITPGKHDPADAAAEATCLALPTTAGSLVGADSGTVGVPVEWNSAAAAAIANPSGLSGQEVVLFQQDSSRGIKPLVMRAATAEGYAVNGRCTTAVALRYMLLVEFTEE